MSESERKRETPAPERPAEAGEKAGRAEAGDRPSFRPADEVLREKHAPEQPGPFRENGYLTNNVKEFPHLEAGGKEVQFHEHGWAGKAKDGTVTTEVKLGDPAAARMGFEQHLHPAKDLVPKGYESSHAIGAGLGVESPYGIAYAPKEVNQERQNCGVERHVRELQANKPPDVDLYLRAEVKTDDRGLLLREINYELYAQPAGSVRGEHRTTLLDGEIRCPATPDGRVGFSAEFRDELAYHDLLRRGAEARRRDS